MSCPGKPAFRISNAAAANPPNPPPTICAFTVSPWSPGFGSLPVSKLLKHATSRDLCTKPLGIAQLFSYNHDRAIYHFERAIALNANDDLIAAEHGRLL